MSSEGPLNARDLMVIIDALNSVKSCNGLGRYHDVAYTTAWAKVFTILDKMEVPSSALSKLKPDGELYPCKPDIFRRKYEEIKDDT